MEDVFGETEGRGQPQGGQPAGQPEGDVFGEAEARGEAERGEIAREIVEETEMMESAAARERGEALTPDEAERRIRGVIGDLQDQRTRTQESQRDVKVLELENQRLTDQIARFQATLGPAPAGAPMRSAVTAGAGGMPSGLPELNANDVLTVADYRRMAAEDRAALMNEAEPLFRDIGTQLRGMQGGLQDVQKTEELRGVMMKHPDYNDVVGAFARGFENDPQRDARLKELSTLSPETLYATAKAAAPTPGYPVSGLAGGAAAPSRHSIAAAEVLRRQSEGVRTAPITGPAPSAPTTIPPGRFNDTARALAFDELTPSDLRRLGLDR